MSPVCERRLLTREQAVSILQIPDVDFQWLVDTRQLKEIRMQGEQRFDSADIYHLIDSYKRTQSRRLGRPWR